MGARRLIEEAVLTPQQRAAVIQAFDAAWAEIGASNVGDAETAQVELAHTLLGLAEESGEDSHALKNSALDLFIRTKLSD